MKHVTKVNILYLSLTEKMSGGEISILNYIKELDNKQFNPLLLCPKEGEFTQRALENHITTFCIPLRLFSFKKPWNYFISLIRLIRFITTKKIHVIHCTSVYSNQLASIAGKILNIPVIVHDQSFLTRQEIRRFLLRHCDKIIACSNAVKENLLRTIKKEKIEVLLHAVHIPEIKDKIYHLHQELGIPKDYTIIAHIGLLEERKRQEDLLKAAAIVIKKYPKTAFLILGDSRFGSEGYDQYLHQLVENLGLKKQVYFLGFRRNIPAILHDLDIVALPSLNEPFSLAMIEALAMAKPFIGADSGGTTEFIKNNHNGILIPPKDHKALADAIMRLLEDHRISQQLGSRGRQSVIQQCNIIEYAKKLEHLYLDCLKL